MADFPAQELMTAAVGTLYEASVTYDLRTPAEFFAGVGTGGASLTNYYLMIGWDTVTPTAITVWQVTGAPDTTGASSGNPTINAATIRILKAWSA